MTTNDFFRRLAETAQREASELLNVPARVNVGTGPFGNEVVLTLSIPGNVFRHRHTFFNARYHSVAEVLQWYRTTWEKFVSDSFPAERAKAREYVGSLP